MNAITNRVVEVMKQVYNLDISLYDMSFLSNTIERRITATKTTDGNNYIKCIENNDVEAMNLHNVLNNNFTQFFREPIVFAVLEKTILPNIVCNKSENGEIRIWSAGCSNGQEAYSIAILLSDLIEHNDKNIQYRIFATDISQEMLEIGRNGSYSINDISDIKVKHIDKYFTKIGNQFVVNEKIKEKVNFSHYDLTDSISSNPPESIYGDFDIVICANVLFYYKEGIKKTIISKLSKAVNSQGYLITGDAEKRFVVENSNLNTFSISSSIFCKSKGDFKS